MRPPSRTLLLTCAGVAFIAVSMYMDFGLAAALMFIGIAVIVIAVVRWIMIEDCRYD